MRSDQIHRALAHGINRFEVCQLVSKGVRATHKSGSRFEDSINDVLQYLGTHDTSKAGLHPAVAPVKLEPAA
ncbi:MAG: DNA-directed RNA polymerase subunit omega [Terracidiphilus sp.]